MPSPAISQLVQQGGQMGLGLMQEKRMRDVFGLEQDKYQAEQEAAGAINQVYQEETEISQKRSAGAKVLAQLRNLAGQTPSVRKATAPVIFDAMNQAGIPVAENFQQFVTTGKSEEVAPILDQIIRGYADDPNRTLDDLQQIITSPLKSSELIGGLSRKVQALETQAGIVGPAQQARKDKFAAQRVSIQRQIQKLEGVASKYAHTKAADVAQQKIVQLQGVLSKMENVLAGSEATALGVRPGTTLTETGDGQLSVLQGPDDSSGGAGGPGGLKASDERFLKQLAASEFDTEINLQTGEIKFKNRNEAALANQITANAARIFADAGGKLTLSEAYQQAKKKAGAGIDGGIPGGNPYDQF